MNEKGGSGKTTLAANLAAFLALRRGRRVLAIDMDPQGQLGKVLGIDVRAVRRSAIDLLLDEILDGASLDAPRPAREAGTAGLPLVRTRIPGLDLVVANKALGLASGWESGGDPGRRLADALERTEARDHYDVILIDAAPSFGLLTLNVLRASDDVVIPVPLTFLALDGCAELCRTIATVRSRYGRPDLRLAMVIPTFYRRTRLAHEVLERLKLRFPKEIANTVVGFHVRLDEAQARGLSIFEYAPQDRAARAMAALAEELELRLAEGANTP